MMDKIANTSLSATATQSSKVLMGWICESRRLGYQCPIADQEMLFRELLCGEEVLPAQVGHRIEYFHPGMGVWCAAKSVIEARQMAERLADGYQIPINLRIGNALLTCYPTGEIAL